MPNCHHCAALIPLTSLSSTHTHAPEHVCMHVCIGCAPPPRVRARSFVCARASELWLSVSARHRFSSLLRRIRRGGACEPTGQPHTCGHISRNTNNNNNNCQPPHRRQTHKHAHTTRPPYLAVVRTGATDAPNRTTPTTPHIHNSIITGHTCTSHVHASVRRGCRAMCAPQFGGRSSGVSFLFCFFFVLCSGAGFHCSAVRLPRGIDLTDHNNNNNNTRV